MPEPTQPTHWVYHVKDGDDGKKYSKTLGVAWDHDDGDGLSVTLEYLPVNFTGKLKIRRRKDGGEEETP